MDSFFADEQCDLGLLPEAIHIAVIELLRVMTISPYNTDCSLP